MNYEKLIDRLDCLYTTSECVHFSKYGNNCENCQKQAMIDAVYAIENLLKLRRWISVDESLPENMTNKVIVCCKNGYVGFGHYEDYNGVKEWYNLESQEPFKAWNDEEDEDDDGYTVTHWMSLPKPHKED